MVDLAKAGPPWLDSASGSSYSTHLDSRNHTCGTWIKLDRLADSSKGVSPLSANLPGGFAIAIHADPVFQDVREVVVACTSCSAVTWRPSVSCAGGGDGRWNKIHSTCGRTA